MNAFAVSNIDGNFATRRRGANRSSSADEDGVGGIQEESISCKCLNIRFPLSSLVQDRSQCIGDHLLDNNVKFESRFPEVGLSAQDHDDDDAMKMIISLLDGPRRVKTDIASRHSHHGAIAALMYVKETKHAGQWSLFRCFNCNTLTHAVSLAKPDVVLVNAGEMLNPAEQDLVVKNNPNYCKFFGVVCSPMDSRYTSPINSSMKPSVMNLVRDIKDNVDDYLHKEKSDMNERVREFEKTQMAAYLDLECSLLAHQQNLENQIRSVYSDSSTDDEDSAFERSIEELSIVNVQMENTEKKERSSTAVDDMFELDPFTYDDDDNTAVNDDLFDDDDHGINETPNYKTRDSSSGILDMAKSVPIPIMRRMRGSTSAVSPGAVSTDSTEGIPDPKDMEASINALARSVGFDGTEIFGELPRPRFNTGFHNPRGRHY